MGSACLLRTPACRRSFLENERLNGPYGRYIMRKHLFLLALLTALPCHAEEWLPLFDGKTLEGWRASEHPESFSVREGSIVCDGPRAHLFYAGAVETADFRNFELEAEFKTRPGANSGIFFHTRFQEEGWPKKGYEVQINNTHEGSGSYREHKKTGSLYAVRNIYLQVAEDDVWCTLRLTVEGKRIRIHVNGTLLVDYTEPKRPVRTQSRIGRVLSSGTFAIQCHDRNSRVFLRNIRVKPLPDDLPPAPDADRTIDEVEAAITRLHAGNFPLIDFHVHLKGGLALEEALELSRSSGINYGIAANCGIGFPVTDDESLIEYVEGLEGKPVFKGMQAEGREWVRLFSEEAIAKFDYVFSDALTFTSDETGRRMRLWMADEVEFSDKQAFMDMYVKKIVGILEREPIDIFVNPTFLPSVIASEYDKLWTEERMDRVIRAAAKHDVAIEINARYRIPSVAFIQRAKAAGVKFSLGTNNGGRELGRLEYCLQVIEKCALDESHMYLPKPDGRKPVQVKGLPADRE